MNKIRHASLFHVLMSNIRKPELECICPNSANTVLTSGTKISLQSSLHKHRRMLPDKFLEITKLSFDSKAHCFIQLCVIWGNAIHAQDHVGTLAQYPLLSYIFLAVYRAHRLLLFLFTGKWSPTCAFARATFDCLPTEIVPQ